MLDWDDLRFFLAVSRHTSLSAAAKSLHVAQSTVGRRLASLEASLGVRLLNRTPDGYVPTLAGEAVRKQAERVETEALTLERQVVGRDKRLAGLVRITSSETIGSNLIAPCCGALHLQHPDIMVELLPNLRELSLSMREADIAIRIHPPEQHDLVVRRIGTIAFGLYASPAYIARHGDLDVQDGLSGHHLITQLGGIQDPAQTDWLATLAPRAHVALQTSSHAAALAAALQGGGLACLLRYRADREGGLLRIDASLLPTAIPSAGLWLVVHKDMRETPRIRVALDHIVKWVRKESHALNPGDAAREIAIARADLTPPDRKRRPAIRQCAAARCSVRLYWRARSGDPR